MERVLHNLPPESAHGVRRGGGGGRPQETAPPPTGEPGGRPRALRDRTTSAGSGATARPGPPCAPRPPANPKIRGQALTTIDEIDGIRLRPHRFSISSIVVRA